MKKTTLTQKYWKNGDLYRFINGDYSFLQVSTSKAFASIEKREYPIGGIDDCFNTECGWELCTQDKFVQAYCEAINAVSAVSGIVHLPLNNALSVASGIVHLPLKMEATND